jgi:hypothetical protein
MATQHPVTPLSCIDGTVVGLQQTVSMGTVIPDVPDIDPTVEK